MRRVLIIILLCIHAICLKSQVGTIPPLEREITLTVQNKPISFVLSSISALADVEFSYSPGAINADELVSIHVEDKSVRYTLNAIFNGAVRYKVRGKYVILQKHEPKPSDNMLVEGYLYDANTGEKLAQATVYSKEQKVSAISDEYGYFKILVTTDASEAMLKVSKVGYSDTLLTSIVAESNYINVDIPVKQQPQFESIQDRVSGQKIIPEWLISRNLKINTRNVSDTLFRTMQLSVAPFLTTNGFLTGRTVNDFSVNMTIGYVQGVNVMEFGGIANIVRKDAGVIQFGGIANIVGGHSHGVQGAGVMNIVRRSSGVQAAGCLNVAIEDAGPVQVAGIGNFVWKNFKGAQAASIFNFSRQLNGIQASGIVNATGTAKGLQMAGIVNHANSLTGLQAAGIGNTSIALKGVQAAGIVNGAKDADGVQVAGIANAAMTAEGVQVAGIVNGALNVKGVQVAGILNLAGQVDGFQVALINYADTCQGIPFGLFSFVRKGYHKIELSANEVFYTNLAFRSGVKAFHSIWSAGFQPFQSGNRFGYFGYGFGTTFGDWKKHSFDIDGEVLGVLKDNIFSNKNTIYRFTLGVDRQLLGKISLTAGLSYNILITNPRSVNYDEAFDKLPPYTLENKTRQDGSNVKSWVGAKVGIRFL